MEVVADVEVNCAVFVHEDRLAILMFLVSERVKRATDGPLATTQEIGGVFDCADWVEYDVFVLISETEMAEAAEDALGLGELRGAWGQLESFPHVATRRPTREEKARDDREWNRLRWHNCQYSEEWAGWRK